MYAPLCQYITSLLSSTPPPPATTSPPKVRVEYSCGSVEYTTACSTERRTGRGSLVLVQARESIIDCWLHLLILNAPDVSTFNIYSTILLLVKSFRNEVQGGWCVVHASASWDLTILPSNSRSTVGLVSSSTHHVLCIQTLSPM